MPRLTSNSTLAQFWEVFTGGNHDDHVDIQETLRNICEYHDWVFVDMQSAEAQRQLRNLLQTLIPLFPIIVQNAYANDIEEALHALVKLALKEMEKMRNPHRYNMRPTTRQASADSDARHPRKTDPPPAHQCCQ